jgi:hypothetical protein
VADMALAVLNEYMTFVVTRTGESAISYLTGGDTKQYYLGMHASTKGCYECIFRVTTKRVTWLNYSNAEG